VPAVLPVPLVLLPAAPLDEEPGIELCELCAVAAVAPEELPPLQPESASPRAAIAATHAIRSNPATPSLTGVERLCPRLASVMIPPNCATRSRLGGTESHAQGIARNPQPTSGCCRFTMRVVPCACAHAALRPGNPAVVGSAPLDRKFCVPAFRRVCVCRGRVRVGRADYLLQRPCQRPRCLESPRSRGVERARRASRAHSVRTPCGQTSARADSCDTRYRVHVTKLLISRAKQLVADGRRGRHGRAAHLAGSAPNQFTVALTSGEGGLSVPSAFTALTEK
jgi:hypothetical protein